MLRSLPMKALASSAERRSGLVTISISATPERLRSTSDIVGVLVVQRLAGILLEMQPLDADPHRLAARQIDERPRPRRRSAILYWLIW